ncbi:MAG: histidinol dehydrogenase [Chloroflexi bacterium]|nr:histidinol dehydrogenase [Chloroflexota bacterium]
MPDIRIFETVEEAKTTVLQRRSLDEMDASPQAQTRLAELFGEPLTPEQAVARIIADVRANGDDALLAWTYRLDGAELDSPIVTKAEIERGWENTPRELRQALTTAADRIRAFHEREQHGSWMDWQTGEALGQIVRPLERVGIYVPGGQGAYPSTLLMAAIPAQVAGVPEIYVVSPPARGQDTPANVTLAAARIAGVTRMFKVGGAQAIAALAYGTESVRRVDKILGPGGLFVVLAMRQVFGSVGIAGLPGPTETLLIADDSANPELVAADLLAQAEHDVLASALLLTPSRRLAETVQKEVAEQLAGLPRHKIIAGSLARGCGIVLVRDLDEALELANEYAPEHLCLLTEDPWSLVGQVRNAGGVFVGETACEAMGDYIVGPSHIMPTGQTARFGSPLHVRDFLKVTSLFSIGIHTLQQTGPQAATIADAEGFQAHAAAIRRRLRGT